MTQNVSNHETFTSCLADVIVAELAPAADPAQTRREKRATRKWRASQKRDNKVSSSVENKDKIPANTADSDQETAQSRSNEAADLAEFVEYLADEIFPCLPLDLRELDYTAVRNDESLAAAYSAPLPLSTLESLVDCIPASTLDSLLAYNLVEADDPVSLQSFLRPLITSYISIATNPPSSLLVGDAKSRPSACEVCGRDWIPLTYHHLIPRGVHNKVIKRGWHEEWRLNSVAWLCRACHSMVHRVATNEELAREYWSVELLLRRDDVRGFAAWIGGIRWKKR